MARTHRQGCVSKVCWIVTALYHWVRTDRCWNRNAFSQWSFDTCEMHLLRSSRWSILLETVYWSMMWLCPLCRYTQCMMKRLAIVRACHSLLQRFSYMYVLYWYVLGMLKPFFNKTGNWFEETGNLPVIGLSLTPSPLTLDSRPSTGLPSRPTGTTV